MMSISVEVKRSQLSWRNNNWNGNTHTKPREGR